MGKKNSRVYLQNQGQEFDLILAPWPPPQKKKILWLIAGSQLEITIRNER
jgi:hypothetical protein